MTGSSSDHMTLRLCQHTIPHIHAETRHKQGLQHGLYLKLFSASIQSVSMASFTDNKALWAIMILTLAGTYVWYKKTKEAFEASEVKWEETSAPYADEYEQNVMD